MSILPLMVGTVVLAVVYGLFWHNQPAQQRDREESDGSDSGSLGGALGLRRPRVPIHGSVLPAGRSARGSSNTAQTDGSTKRKVAPDKDQTLANPITPSKDEVPAHSC